MQDGALCKMTRGNECLGQCTEIFNIHSNRSLQTQKRSNQIGILDVAEGSLLIGAIFTDKVEVAFTTNQRSRD